MAPPVPPHALERLLAERAWVRDLARALTRDAGAADDLEQEVWLRALRKPPGPVRSARAWLGTVMRRTAVDAHRTATRRARREQGVASNGVSAATADVVAQADLHRWVAQAVLSLPEPYHGTILLRFVEGQSLAQVAEQQGVPLETVRTRQRRALHMLRERLPAQNHRKRAAAVPAAAALGKIAAGSAGVFAMGKLVAGAAVLGLCIVGFVLWNPGAETTTVPDSVVVDEPRAEPRPLSGPGAPQLAGGTAPPPVEAPPPQPSAKPRPQWKDHAPNSKVEEGPAAAPGVIAGRVQDLEGEPIPRAEVHVWHKNQIVARTRTDERGAFQLDALPDEDRLLVVHGGGWANIQHTVRPGRHEVIVTMDLGLSIRGTLVAQDNGEALADIRLLAKHTDASAYGVRQVPAVSAEDGTFRVRGLPPGEYELVYRPSHDDLFLPHRVAAISAGTTDLRIELERGLMIEGLIRGPDGQAWRDGATVRASPRSPAGDTGYGRMRWTLVKADGTFSITGLAREPYDITVLPGEAGAIANISQVPAGTTELVIDLPRGVSVKGRILDDAGNPVAGNGYVWLCPGSTHPGEPGSVAAKLDGKGSFVTSLLDPGQAYVIHASGFSGYGAVKTDALYPSDDPVDVTLRSGTRLSGRVFVGSAPVGARIPVAARATELKAGEFQEPWAYVSTTTDAEGRFTLGGLAERTYEVSAGGGTSGFVGQAAKQIVNAPAKDLVLQAVRGVLFRGRLVDAAGEPMSSIYVQVRSKNGRAAGRTDRNGWFTIDAAPKGELTAGAMIGGTWTPLGTHTAPANDVEIRVPE